MNDKKGSVTIESAICFTMVLVLIAGIVSALNLYRTDILMTRAVNQTCENVSLLFPLTVPAGDAASVLLNAFPDTSLDGTNASKVLGTVAKVAGGVDQASGHKLQESVLEGVLAGTMAKNIVSYYKQRNGGSSFFCPDDIDVRLDISTKRHIIEVTTDYSVVTIVGRKDKTDPTPAKIPSTTSDCKAIFTFAEASHPATRPPRASMSRTICPLATPPTAGLQLMRPMAFMSMVSMAVLTPSFQAA